SYQQALTLKPDWADAHLQLGNALLDQGKQVEAIKSYQQAIAMKPDWADAHWQLGNALLEQGKQDAAIESYQQALTLKPDWADGHWQLGSTLSQQGKLERAIASYQRALDIYQEKMTNQSELAQLHINLGNILLAQEKFKEAFKTYEQALKIQPNFSEEVIANYKNYLTINPQFVELYLPLIKLLVDVRKFAEAYQSYVCVKEINSKLVSGIVDIYQNAIAIKPDSNLYLHLGEIFQDQNQLEEASNSYERAVHAQPDSIRAHLQLGMALRSQGKVDQAFSCCQRALEIDPNSAIAYYRLADIFLTQGKRDDALRCYYQSNKIKFAELRGQGNTGGMCFFPLQRSGSVYTNYALSRGLSIPFASDPTVGGHNTIGQYLVQTSLENHRLKDCIITGHVLASTFNLLLLSLYVDRLVVHVRDPRQTTLSMIYYMQNLWKRSPIITLSSSITEKYFSMSLTDQISWQIENWGLPEIIKWIEGWVDAEEDPLFYPKILFTRNEDLATDPESFFESILNFYEIEKSRFTFPIPPEFKAGTHNRKGQIDEWREVFTPEQAEKASSMIPERLIKRFGWPAK
ncbi:tetratricopeptide repeat protein, partial [Microcoleus sp. herbarium14]|uniref:tetratricopeptide repeat protein n=1 Tax=Microcoleus sp. herbarium14 TaxID=3055439 RepID=UPI002FD0D9C6